MRLQRTAIVTGISGQDGAYLAQLLLSKGYLVYGTARALDSARLWRLAELGILAHPSLRLECCDSTAKSDATAIITRVQPDEVYNLAGQSSAVKSMAEPLLTAETNAVGALRLLDAIRTSSARTRFFQAGSAEIFGQAAETPQIEKTPFAPNNPYAVSKLFAHWATVDYRDRCGIFAVSGILFNHESSLRGAEFVTRKIASGFARIQAGLQDTIELGNLDAVRDWAYAGDIVKGMWMSLQADDPDTFVFATGTGSTVRDFVSLAANAAGMNLEWQGAGMNEVGIDILSGKVVVRVSPSFYRPIESYPRIGSPDHAHKKLGWVPSTNLPTLCTLMVSAEVQRIQQRNASQNYL